MTRGTFRGLFSSILLPFPLLFLSLLYSLAIGISHTHVVSGSIVVTMLNAALLISVFHPALYLSLFLLSYRLSMVLCSA